MFKKTKLSIIFFNIFRHSLYIKGYFFLSSDFGAAVVLLICVLIYFPSKVTFFHNYEININLLYICNGGLVKNGSHAWCMFTVQEYSTKDNGNFHGSKFNFTPFAFCSYRISMPNTYYMQLPSNTYPSRLLLRMVSFRVHVPTK